LREYLVFWVQAENAKVLKDEEVKNSANNDLLSHYRKLKMLGAGDFGFESSEYSATTSDGSPPGFNHHRLTKKCRRRNKLFGIEIRMPMKSRPFISTIPIPDFNICRRVKIFSCLFIVLFSLNFSTEYLTKQWRKITPLLRRCCCNDSIA